MECNDWTLGQIEAVFKKLGGNDGVRRLLAGELEGRPTRPKFDAFRTINLGTDLRTAEHFLRALRENGNCIGDRVCDILASRDFISTVAIEEMKVDLVRVSAVELGFKYGVRLGQLYDRAEEFGLRPCRPEVGYQLRRQYNDQPRGEQLFIGMDPIRDSDGNMHIFSVGCDRPGFYLDSRYERADYVWSVGYQWVFVRPRR